MWWDGVFTLKNRFGSTMLSLFEESIVVLENNVSKTWKKIVNNNPKGDYEMQSYKNDRKQKVMGNTAFLLFFPSLPPNLFYALLRHIQG